MVKGVVFFLLRGYQLLIVIISGCSTGTSQVDKAKNKIVEIGNQFLNYELTADEASEKLDSIAIPETEGNGHLYLEVDKDYLSFLIIKTKNNSTTFEAIKDKIEWIKEHEYE